MALTPAELFSVAGMVPVPGWLLLVAVPRWRYTLPIVRFGLVVALAALYVWLIVNHLGDGPGNFNSLDGVAQLFGNRSALLAGWVHYLAFDLFIGAWIVEDSQRQNISRWLVLPTLPLTFLLGPSGLLLYLALRGAMSRRATIAVSSPAPGPRPADGAR